MEAFPRHMWLPILLLTLARLAEMERKLIILRPLWLCQGVLKRLRRRKLRRGHLHKLRPIGPLRVEATPSGAGRMTASTSSSLSGT